MRPLYVFLLILLVVGCSSQPTYYYTYLPDKIISDKIITFDDPSHGRYVFDNSNISYRASNFGTFTSKVNGAAFSRSLQLREIKYVDYSRVYRNPAKTNVRFSWDETNYMYVLPSVSVKSLTNSVGGSIMTSTGPAITIDGGICNTYEYPCDMGGGVNGWGFGLPIDSEGHINRPFYDIMEELEPSKAKTIGELRNIVSRFIWKTQYFPLPEALPTKVDITSQNIHAYSSLKSLELTRVTTEDKTQINMQFQAHGKSFTLDPVQLGGSKEYRHLMGGFVDKRESEITLKHEETGVTTSLSFNYYDGTRFIKEIKRMAALGKGYIRLTASMNNVDVYIDGEKQGSISNGRPFVTALVEGRHQIQVKRDFFGSKSIAVNIEEDDAFAYHFDLKPSGNLAEEMGQGKIIQSTGVLVVVTSRNDLSIQIDGQTRIPPFKLPNISSGIHKMRIDGPKGERVIIVTVNENQKLLVKLDDLY